MKFGVFCIFLYGICVTLLPLQAREIQVPNELGISWPWDLTYVTLQKGEKATSVAMPNGTLRPLQIETEKGERRAWFVATLGKEKSHTLSLKGDAASPGIQINEGKEGYLIDNGLYEFRVRKSRRFSPALPLSEVPHWNGGARLSGKGAWDGRAWSEGNAKVKEVEVKILRQGPVFVDMHILYHFEGEVDGSTEALPLELGKQVHAWKPNTPPREEIPKRANHYEAKVRFVMGDPWVEVNERFRLPRDKDAGSFGVHQHWVSWGEPKDSPDIPGFSSEHMKVDTVAWVRWFLYDVFGGNTNQNEVPAQPRADQKGRPFALLRPRWNQGGGGAQDFLVFGGGKSPPSLSWLMGRHLGGDIRNLERKGTEEQKAQVKALKAKANNKELPFDQRLQAAADIGKMVNKPVRMPAADYSPDNPAMGVIAAFASKWVGPYPNTIAVYAYDGTRARARFPLLDGERSGLHYGQRSYALLTGKRSQFGSLNNIVRRHTDWTLVAQMHKYVLSWERDPELAGPSAKITRKQLDNLRAAYKSGEGIAGQVLRESVGDLDKLLAEHKELSDKRKVARDLSRKKGVAADEQKKAKEEEKALGKEIKKLDGKLNKSDMQLLRMITKDWSRSVKAPTAELWIQRRYQDDFLNPTQRTPRAVAEYANADLFSGGKPYGGAWNAALAYIATDLDSWPGWHQGWSPGNPNFHTDKYMGAIYIASAMRDHPHSKEWMAFGWDNFQEDVKKVLLAPDGTGYECPGYSGYSLQHQLSLAQIFVNAGFGNPVAENPMFKGSGRWHRKLITPYDKRIERRHAAPIGDTHRWDSGLSHGFGKLAKFYSDADPEFASEMQGAWKLLTDNGLRIKNRLKTQLLDSDPTIPPMDPNKMDWSGEVFHGFGALMRNNFGTEEESFLSIKAGPLRGHYHNDEMSYHFYANGSPISLDYNCSYTPRGDHAALHNSMTFGRNGTLKHNKRNDSVKAMEEMGADAWPGAFASSEDIDVFVAERKQSGLTMRPIDPGDSEFGRQYPYRKTAPLVHRRFTAFVKHPVKSDFSDYLVVRDETQSEERQQVNIHLLARSAKQEGNLILADGQYDMDMAIYVAEATDLEVEHLSWWYSDQWMTSPGDEYTIREGESMEDWDRRMAAFMKQNKVKSLPLSGWKPAWKGGKDAPNPYTGLIAKTNGKALIPPKGWTGTWMYGEYQHWLRLHSKPGTPIMWVLYPYPKGTKPPSFEPLADGSGVRVTLNGKSEEIYLSTTPASGQKGQAVFSRNGKEQVLLASDAVPALGQIPKKPLND